MSEAKLVKVYRTKAQWQEVMDRYHSSDLTQVKFCEREGLPLASFQKWQAKLRAAVAVKRSFVELPSKLSGDTWRVELELADGSILRLR
ncbi:MAG: hypothetical protein MN733_41235 [Nitrososphaera sp.]|nr:hypothetical protein [Nitrososphaera sp.]